MRGKKITEKKAIPLPINILENITQLSLNTYLSCYIKNNLIMSPFIIGLFNIIADKGKILH